MDISTKKLNKWCNATNCNMQILTQNDGAIYDNQDTTNTTENEPCDHSLYESCSKWIDEEYKFNDQIIISITYLCRGCGFVERI